MEFTSIPMEKFRKSDTWRSPEDSEVQFALGNDSSGSMDDGKTWRNPCGERAFKENSARNLGMLISVEP